MMKKEDLLAIPVPKAQPIAPGKRYRCAKQLRKVNGVRVTVYNFWMGGGELYFRTFRWEGRFCTQVHSDDGRHYIPPHLQPDRWSDAMVDKFIYRGGSWSIAHDRERPFTCVEGGDIAEQLYRFQSGIREKALRDKHKKVRQTTALLMDQLRPLPKDTERFLTDTVFRESRYIYYETAKTRKGKGKTIKTLRGFCTHCGRDVELETDKIGQLHNTAAKCPACRSAVMLKGKNKVSPYLQDDRRFLVMQRTRDGVAIRGFWARREYRDHPRRPKNEYHENSRVFLSGDGTLVYFDWEHGMNRETGKYEWQWKRRGDSGLLFPTEGILYTRNLGRVLAGTPWQYSGLAEYAKSSYALNPEDYLKKYMRCPSLEYLAKMGLHRVIDEHLPKGGYGTMGSYYRGMDRTVNSSVVDLFGKSLKEVLPLSEKQDLPLLVALNASVKVIEFVAIMRTIKKKICAREIRWILDFGGEGALRPFRKAARFCSNAKIAAYMEQQCAAPKLPRGNPYKKNDRANLFGDWTDYLNMIEYLGWDMCSEQLLYPEDLKAAHDRATELSAVHAEETQNRAVAAMEAEYRARFGFETKQLMIVVPHTAADITREGKLQHHCVGSYLDAVVKGNTVILFVRRKKSPDVPYYTLEVRDGEVSQCRGKRNANMTPDVKKFIEAFKHNVLARPPRAAAG